MKPEDDPGLRAIARAIASGESVDWSTVGSGAGVSASHAAVLHHLKAVAAIADLHRSLPDLPSVSSVAVDSSVAVESPAPAGVRPASDIAEPRTWGQLTVLERVGGGAFGDVYRARDPRLEREVALKLLRRLDHGEQQSDAESVIHEGRLLARVRHPNVVTVHGAGAFDGRVGIWMEFVRGRTLQSVLRDHGPYGAHEAAVIGLDILRALSAVHAAGLVHRDIKAHNVMREDGGRIVLMDFGTGLDTVTPDGPNLAGTPLYLAPELFTGSRPTPQTDIYSVGVLLYLLATGSYPVFGDTLKDLRRAHAAGRRRWLRDVRPDLPEVFVDVVERALAPNVSERYQTAGEIERDLRRVLSPTEVPASDADSDATSVAAGIGEVDLRRRHLLWAVGALLGVGAIGVGVFGSSAWRNGFGFRDRGRPPNANAALALTNRTPTRRRIPFPEYGVIGSPSADGTLFSLSDVSGNLAVVTLATSEVRRVTDDAVFGRHSQYAEASVISPDSTQIAYTWLALDGTYELRASDLGGTEPRVLLRDPTVGHVEPLQWSVDGQDILTVLTAPDGSRAIALVNAANGTRETLTTLGRIPPHHASVSPDGVFAVYDHPSSASAMPRDIFIVRRGGTEPRRLTSGPANDVDPVWTADGTQVLFISDRSGTMDLWTVRVEDGTAVGDPVILQRNVGRILPRGITTTGAYYFHEITGTVDVYEASLTADTVATARAIPAAYTGSNISSLWSPDGTRLAYASRRGAVRFDRGWTTIVVRDLATGHEIEVTPMMNSFLLRAWSPDGRSVLVQGADSQGRTGMHRIDLGTGSVTAVLLNAVSQNDFRRPDWRADGQIVYINSRQGRLYSRDVERDRDDLLWDFGRERINVISNINGRGYRLSPDSQLLAYTGALKSPTARRVLVARDLSSAAARELLSVPEDDAILLHDWTPDGTALYFTRGTSDPAQPVALWRMPINGEPATPVGLAMEGLRDISVHPDDERITFTAGWPEAELWVMEHFLTQP